MNQNSKLNDLTNDLTNNLSNDEWGDYETKQNDTNDMNDTKEANNTDDFMDDFDDTLFEYYDNNLIKGIHSFGFDTPSLIQSKTIIPISKGYDIIAQAQSGSGKTGAFIIGSLTRINIELKYPQVLIISNTRELANQTYYVANEISSFIQPLKKSLCIGGINTVTNLHEAVNSHMLIGTPGRLIDLIDRDAQNNPEYPLLSGIRTLILDEADSLLKDDFMDQIKKIITKLSDKCQICLFSATYPDYVLDMTKLFMRDPLKILVENEKLSVESITNYYINSGVENNKFDILLDLYNKVTITQTVIFVNSVGKAKYVGERLQQFGHSVGIIHSDLDDLSRRKALTEFRRNHIRVLVSTDIISRGIDVQQVGLVINYDVPNTPIDYIHRVGRSGRFGRRGTAITFVNLEERQTKYKKVIDYDRMGNIEMEYRIEFNEMPDLQQLII